MDNQKLLVKGDVSLTGYNLHFFFIVLSIFYPIVFFLKVTAKSDLLSTLFTVFIGIILYLLVYLFLRNIISKNKQHIEKEPKGFVNIKFN